MRPRDRTAAKRRKGRWLDEICTTAGRHRKSVIRALGRPAARPPRLRLPHPLRPDRLPQGPERGTHLGPERPQARPQLVHQPGALVHQGVAPQSPIKSPALP